MNAVTPSTMRDLAARAWELYKRAVAKANGVVVSPEPANWLTRAMEQLVVLADDAHPLRSDIEATARSHAHIAIVAPDG